MRPNIVIVVLLCWLGAALIWWCVERIAQRERDSNATGSKSFSLTGGHQMLTTDTTTPASDS